MLMATDRRVGATADWMRRKVGKSPVPAIRSTTRRVSRLERTVGMQLKVPRGLWMQGATGPVIIPFDARGLIQVWSPQETIDLAKTPWARKHALGLDIDTGLIPEGCACCPEDMNYEVLIIGAPSVTGEWLFNEETCTRVLVLTFECDPCVGGPGGGV
ncbi:MAG: hypothetical protein IT341_07090 [Chloroflexi bacterium]|nr:hypothetical protein [Chloroflexota bacterium]